MSNSLIILIMPVLFLFIFIGLPLIIILTIRRRNNYPIQNDIQPFLAPGETLLGCTRVSISADGVVTDTLGQRSEAFVTLPGDTYYAGLTDKRILLVADKHRNKVFSFPFPEILGFDYSRDGGWASSNLIPGFLYIRLRGATLVLKAQGKKWWQRAEQMMIVYKRMQQKF
jgi:hypothetical protein